MSIQLLHGDCIELLKAIPSASINLIVADLPYGTTKARWDTPISLDALWVEYKRIIKPTGAILLFAQSPFDKVLGCSNLSMFRYEIIWRKTEPTGHLNAKRMPMKAHENILVFYKKLPTYNPQKTHGHIRKQAISDCGKDKTELYGKQAGIKKYSSTERYPLDVVKFSSDKQRENLHPTQKPLALLEYLIKTYSNKGDTVLDNVMGSGTTGLACINLGRNFIGMELDSFYFGVALKRLS